MFAKERSIPATLEVLSPYNRFAKTPHFSAGDEGKARLSKAKSNRLQASAKANSKAVESLTEKTPPFQGGEAYSFLETLRLEKAYGDLIENFGSFITESYVKKGFITSERGKHVFGDYRLGLLESGEAERMAAGWAEEPKIIHNSSHRETDGSYGPGDVFEVAATIYPEVFDPKLFLKWRKSPKGIKELRLFRRLGKEGLKPGYALSTELGQYMAGLIVLNLFRKQGLTPYSAHIRLLREEGSFLKNMVEESLKRLVKTSVPYEFVARHLDEALIEMESRLFGNDFSKIQCWRTLMLTNLGFKVKDEWLTQILLGNIDLVIRKINEMVKDGPDKIIPDWVDDCLKVIESKDTYKSREWSLPRTSPQNWILFLFCFVILKCNLGTYEYLKIIINLE